MLLTCRFSPNASRPRHRSPTYSNYIRDGAVIPLTVGGQVARRWVAHGEGKRAAVQEGVGAEVRVDVRVHFSSLQVGDERVGCAFFLSSSCLRRGSYPLIGQRLESGSRVDSIEIGGLVLQFFRLPPLPRIPSSQESGRVPPRLTPRLLAQDDTL